MRSKGLAVLCGAAALCFALGSQAAAQTKASSAAPATPPGGDLRTGPATVSPHWSKYKYPESVPEGASYHIVEKGDTLWDLSRKYLGNPFLWPQIWDQNRYVTDAHWIYPGDPLVFPKIALVSAQAGQAGAGTGLEEGGKASEGTTESTTAAAGSVLYPVTEEMSLQCAQYVLSSSEDTSLRVAGSERGSNAIGMASRDILYLNKGSNAGVKAGDVYSIHHEAYTVKHPQNGRSLGTKIETTGWGRVILVEENSATLMVEQACFDIHQGDYLTPFEKVNVPLALRRIPADRLTPRSGKAHGYIVDMQDDIMIGGFGHLLTIDLGSQDGVAPGNVFVVYRIMYPSVPTPRNVLGEVTVVSVRDRTATAKVTYSNDAFLNGDEIELR